MRTGSRWLAALGFGLGILGLCWSSSVAVAYMGVTSVGRGDPAFRQLTDVSCGPASLRYLLNYKYGKDVPEEEISILAKTSDTGTTLLGLKRAAIALGHEAIAWRWSERELSTLPVPAIIHLPRWQHFAVITEVKGTEITVYDPIRGHLKFTLRAFRYFWEGIVLEVR